MIGNLIFMLLLLLLFIVLSGKLLGLINRLNVEKLQQDNKEDCNIIKNIEKLCFILIYINRHSCGSPLHDSSPSVLYDLFS